MGDNRPANIEALERRATALEADAHALADSYNRSTWYRFTAVFFPIPFVVVLLRLQLDYWHYYIAGSAYLIFAAALYIYDGRASDRCKVAQAEAEEAKHALQEARSGAVAA